jgi:hypothetical protein
LSSPSLHVESIAEIHEQTAVESVDLVIEQSSPFFAALRVGVVHGPIMEKVVALDIDAPHGLAVHDLRPYDIVVLERLRLDLMLVLKRASS